MKKYIIILLIVLMSVSVFTLVGCNKSEVEYKYDKVEKSKGVTDNIEILFVNATITVKDNVLIAKKGNETTLVLELKDNNKTGLDDYTYAYENDRLIIIYQNKVHVYLKEA